MPVPFQHFTDFASFYEALKFDHRTMAADFDLIRFGEDTRIGVGFMPPFRKDWYQVVLKLNPTRAVWLNAVSVAPRGSLLLFNSPSHVYSWQTDPELRGFVLFFKASFLDTCPEVETTFPFFRLSDNNVLLLGADDAEALVVHLDLLYATAEREGKFWRQAAQSLLLSFLYECRSRQTTRSEAAGEVSTQTAVFVRYQGLVNKFYLEHRTVAAYAALMHLTPNHLNDCIKAATGKNARHFIVERVMVEARNLLRHTRLDVKSIAFTLQFEDASNFSKFFRRYAQQTPGQFRQSE